MNPRRGHIKDIGGGNLFALGCVVKGTEKVLLLLELERACASDVLHFLLFFAGEIARNHMAGNENS